MREAKGAIVWRLLFVVSTTDERCFFARSRSDPLGILGPSRTCLDGLFMPFPYREWFSQHTDLSSRGQTTTVLFQRAAPI